MKKLSPKLLALTLALLVAAGSIVGGTLAWFTDSVTTGVNTIQAGNLDIDLVDANNNSLAGDTIGFVNADDNTLWEPGCRYMLEPVTLVNNGTLYAKYVLSISAVNGLKDGAVDLASVIDVYETIDNQEVKIGTLRSLIGAEIKHGVIAPGEKHSFQNLTLKMQETAGNEYQGKSLTNISIAINAGQQIEEQDSFDNQYDLNAPYYENAVATQEEFDTAIQEAKAGDTIQLTTPSLSLTSIPEGVTIKGNGASNTTVNVGTGLDVSNNNVTISDVEIKGDFSGRTAAVRVDGANATVSGVVLNTTKAFYGVQTNTKSSGEVVIENSTIVANERAVYDFYSNCDSLVIRNCVLDALYPINSDTENENLVLTVENCTLNGWTSFSAIKSASFTNTKFGKSTYYGYAYLRPYTTTTLTNCDFIEDFTVDPRQTSQAITFINCTYNGVPLTAENAATLFVNDTITDNVKIINE